MNANELADYLERDFQIQEAVIDMLRQQQAEIGFYKQDADKYKLKCESQQAEIEALKSVVYWLKENRSEVWDDIQKWRKL
jgi:hypothetical protein